MHFDMNEFTFYHTVIYHYIHVFYAYSVLDKLKQ